MRRPISRGSRHIKDANTHFSSPFFPLSRFASYAYRFSLFSLFSGPRLMFPHRESGSRVSLPSSSFRFYIHLKRYPQISGCIYYNNKLHYTHSDLILLFSRQTWNFHETIYLFRNTNKTLKRSKCGIHWKMNCLAQRWMLTNNWLRNKFVSLKRDDENRKRTVI